MTLIYFKGVFPFEIPVFQTYDVSMTQISTSTVQEIKFSVKDFFSKCDQIRRKLWISWHLLK